MKQTRELTFEDFKRRAADPMLTPNEKIGFPDSYRKGCDDAIVADIRAKLPTLNGTKKTIIDIGSGCGSLTHAFIAYCRKQQHRLIVIDSKEMLSQLPNIRGIIKKPGYFPDMPDLLKTYAGKADAVLCYSVIHYIFGHDDVFRFIHEALTLLAQGGRLLIGDIPNLTKRQRFLTSPEGKTFTAREKLTNDKGDTVHADPRGKIDDTVILSILSRARSFGFEAYLLPQDSRLPMANRREDILIARR